jgi:hypothetical protein
MVPLQPAADADAIAIGHAHLDDLSIAACALATSCRRTSLAVHLGR